MYITVNSICIVFTYQSETLKVVIMILRPQFMMASCLFDIKSLYVFNYCNLVGHYHEPTPKDGGKEKKEKKFRKRTKALCCIQRSLHVNMSLALSSLSSLFLFSFASIIFNSRGHVSNLKTSPNSSFKVALFADLHYGEAASTDWGPQQDKNSSRAMSTLLDMEKPGKQIHPKYFVMVV